MRFCGPEVFELIRLAELAARGSWPAPGGTLDQTRWFLQVQQHVELTLKKITRDE